MQSKIIFCIITIAFSLSLIKSRGINVSPIEKREFFYPITEECITCLKSLGTFSEKAIKTISKQSTMSKSQILRIQYECRDKLMPDERIFAKQNDILRLLSRDNGVGECLKKIPNSYNPPNPKQNKTSSSNGNSTAPQTPQYNEVIEKEIFDDLSNSSSTDCIKDLKEKYTNYVPDWRKEICTVIHNKKDHCIPPDNLSNNAKSYLSLMCLEFFPKEE